ncbi:MAG: subunit of branched-chain alpha-keto acid dehydrogenase [Paenibacillaceae bacterium]|nr:subunit of branched-chain alpha-keto acid dehydrogenase [Paenibacillaceae bacterium]
MGQTKPEPTAVTVPHLAESLVSATIERWLKQPGDEVEQYEVLCELITEKVNVEMPSPVAGTLRKILVGEGETAAVGAAICLIEEHDGAASEAGASANAGGALGGAAVAVGAAGTHAAAAGGEPAQAGSDQSMRGRYSPAVLRLAAEHGIDLTRVQGSGLGGRITRQDVERVIAGGAASASAATPTAAGTTAAAPRAAQPPAAREAGLAQELEPEVVHIPLRSTGLHLTEHSSIPKIEVEGQPIEGRGEYFIDVTPIRHAIASHTRQSVTEIPHAWTMIEVDVTNLVFQRNKLKDEFMRNEGINLTYLPFVLKAVVNAIKDYPIMNSVWAVDKIIVKRDINISLLVGTEEFVTSPVIKKADEKTIAGLARDIDELTRRARAGKLRLDDMQGGTFTVNNTGSFGSLLSYPIINYPQAAILTFESIVKRPVVIQDMIAVRSMVNLCLSLDHRILDGVICGRFLQRVKENLESYNQDTRLY